MENVEKEVYFDQYCKSCEHEKKAEDEDPCYDCLAEPVNVDSHKPVYYKKKVIWIFERRKIKRTI